jgi:hypothetical protein
MHVPIDPPVSIYAVFRRFNYKAWTALAEFVDNSLQSFYSNTQQLARDPYLQQHVSVTIDLYGDQITVKDDAAGIPKGEFPRAFRASIPPSDNRGLNEFGMGMKCAAFWFSQRWTVRTVHLGDGVLREVELDMVRIRESTTASVPVRETSAVPNEHGTVITLHSVGDRMPKGRTLEKVSTYLGDIYRVPIRLGHLRIKVNGQLCQAPQSATLVAPTFNSNCVPIGDPVRWHKPIECMLDASHHVSGFAALFPEGNRADAGFTLFRRGRVVDGFPNSRWKPGQIFGAANSAAAMRIFGELHFDGFGVSSQKDQLDWGGYEERFIDWLRAHLVAEPVPILSQARNYRVPVAAPDGRIEESIGRAVTDTGHALQQLPPELAESVSPSVRPDDAGKTSPLQPARTELLVTTRTFQIRFDSSDWIVEFQFPKQCDSGDWLDVRGGVTDIRDPGSGHPLLQISLALDHPFSRNFLSMTPEHLEPVLRIVASLALAERLARLAGVAVPGIIRARMNQVLTQALAYPEGRR